MKSLLILALFVALAFSIRLSHDHDDHDDSDTDVSQKLTEDVLFNNLWSFSNDGGYLSYDLGFAPNGVIKNFVANNEKTWKWDTTGHLCFVSADGRVSTRWAEAFTDWFGRWHLQGRFALGTDGWRHYLVQNAPKK